MIAFVKETKDGADPWGDATSVGGVGEAGLPDKLGLMERGALTLRLHGRGGRLPKAGAGHGGVD